MGLLTASLGYQVLKKNDRVGVCVAQGHKLAIRPNVKTLFIKGNLFFCTGTGFWLSGAGNAVT